MAPPSRLTPSIEAKILSVLQTGVSIKTAAAHVGLAERTVQRWVARGRDAKTGKYRDFALAVDKAREDAQILCAAVWRQAVQKGDWRAARAFLERRYPDEWGKRETVEVRADVNHTGGIVILPPEKDDV